MHTIYKIHSQTASPFSRLFPRNMHAHYKEMSSGRVPLTFFLGHRKARTNFLILSSRVYLKIQLKKVGQDNVAEAQAICFLHKLCSFCDSLSQTVSTVLLSAHTC